jgi:hypothetical protein
MSSQSHLTPEFDQRLHKVADAFVGTMPEKDVASFRYLIDAGEPGVGLENFCVQFDEHNVPVDPAILWEIRDLAMTMRLDRKYWTRLRQA